jgi:polygalacturonase
MTASATNPNSPSAPHLHDETDAHLPSKSAYCQTNPRDRNQTESRLATTQFVKMNERTQSRPATTQFAKMNERTQSRPALLTLLAIAPLTLYAQDTRTVHEPAFPTTCTTLTANLIAANATLQPADEPKTDTRRIQQALDSCPPGKAVELRPDATHNAFLSGPLDLRRGVTLLIDAGVTLYASRNPRDYDREPGVCGTITEKGHGCRAVINGNNVPDAAIMGDGTIDGRGGEKILGQPVSWWELAEQARKGANRNNPRLIALTRCNNFTLYRITLRNSPNFHVSYSGGDGFTVWGVKVWSPKNACNTDGIDPGNSTNVPITHSWLHIGSETDGGASAIRVTDLSIDGADNGIRIKSNSSRGGLVRDIVYEDVCIRDTKNPIFMDTNYSFSGTDRDKIPDFKEITLRNVRVQGGGKVTFDGFDAAHPLGMNLENVSFDNPAAIEVAAKDAVLRVGPNFNLPVSGPSVNLWTTLSTPAKNSCEGNFVDFPTK